MDKLSIRILGIDGVLGYDSIGITLREYIRILTGRKSDKLTYSRSFSCNSSFFKVRKGDVVIVLDNNHTALAIVDGEYTQEEQSELSPQRDIIAKVDLSDYVYSQRMAMEKEELYNRIIEMLSGDLKSKLSISGGKLYLISSDISEEIQELINKYNSYYYEKAFVGKARLNKSSVNHLYDPAYVGRCKVGRATVDILN